MHGTTNLKFINAYVNNSFTFFMPAYYFHRFFTRIALGDVDLRLSLMSVREANAAGEETTSAARLYHQHDA
jgi:hypothetical protein